MAYSSKVCSAYTNTPLTGIPKPGIGVTLKLEKAQKPLVALPLPTGKPSLWEIGFCEVREVRNPSQPIVQAV